MKVYFLKRLLFIFIGSMYSTIVLAGEVPTIGEFADQLMEPVGILSDFIGTGAIVIGIACIFASFLRYMQHRVNPLAAPISTVIMLLVLGLVLLGLPFIHLLTGTGITFPHK